MKLSDIYEFGRSYPLGWDDQKMQKKLTFVLFPYTAKEVTGTAVTALLLGVGTAFLAYFLFPFVAFALLFLAVVAAIVLYIYPGQIYYTRAISEYNEEMLRAILRMTTFISMNMSLEYAFVETSDHLHGTLELQFKQIKHSITRKQKTTLGDAIEPYLPIWNEINPIFVKSLRLLQTAALSSEEDRTEILNETIETMLLNYTTMGKRYAEELSGNAQKLITVGILIPIMSLMLLPLLSIFLPQFVRPEILAFLYLILFPTLTLLMALNFGAKRLQVDTIRIEDAKEYKPLSPVLGWLCVAGAFVLAIPTIIFIATVKAGEPGAESLLAIFWGWLISFGIVAGLYIYAKIYTKRYGALWEEVNEIEQDLPHLLQSFSTYLTLNISTENAMSEIINDYEQLGFGKHPVLKAFRKIRHTLMTSKESLTEIADRDLPKLLPSRKVNQILIQMLSFGAISQKSSAKVAKMVREQTISIYKLDDYLKTMLAETVGLINVTTTILAPLLAAAAVIMSVAIVKSIVYIGEQLQSIASTFGTSAGSFNIVDTSKVIPPVYIEVIVGLYLVETIIILSLFSTTINVGNDRYKLYQTIALNMSGFLIYTILLFGGYLFIVEVFFKRVLMVG